MRKIERRTFLNYLASGAAATVIPALGFGIEKSKTARRPNIIIVMARDTDSGDIGCYGNSVVKTPHLDQLAEKGVRFTDFHSSAPVLSPTMVGMMTGCYQQRFDAACSMAQNHHCGSLKINKRTWVDLLISNGYVSNISGKKSLEHYSTDHTELITRQAVSFIERKNDQPFCLFLPYTKLCFPSHNNRDVISNVAIESIDHSIGQIVSSVKHQGLEEGTFIFFFSGSGSRNTNASNLHKGGKGNLWEGGHRVPAIASWPGRVRPSTVCNELTISLDLFPTILTIGEVPVSEEHFCDGANLLPLLTEGKRLKERNLFWGYSGSRVVRQGHWKLFLNRNGEHKGLHLFNLAEDIGERRNLFHIEKDKLQALQTALLTWEWDVKSHHHSGRSVLTSTDLHL